VRDRLAGAEVPLDREEFDDLCRVHLYDWLEQVPRSQKWDYRRTAYRRLAERLGGAVHLARPVERVAWSAHRVEVRAGGATVTADAAVLTVPASVGGRIRFDPPLPAWKAGALGRVVYGHAAKLFVPLRSAPPPSAVLSVPDRFWTWTARGAGGAVQPVVSAFAGSAPALRRLRVAAGPGTWFDRLRALRPDLDLDEAGALLSTWDDDPWARAAYSTRTPAARPGDDQLLARPVGPLHFAGEHTAGAWAGLMEGALRSGERAAAELLEAPVTTATRRSATAILLSCGATGRPARG
jgi:monoamine oxidase